MLVFLSTTKLSLKEKEFLENLYATQNKRIWYLAISILKNKEQSEDVFQSVFKKLIEKVSLLQSFQNQDKINGYVYVMTKNMILETFRKNKKQSHIAYENIENLTFHSGNVENIVITKENLAFAEKEIEKLKVIDREIIYLHHFLGVSYKEIASTYNMTIDNIRMHVYNTLKKLRSAIKKNN